MCHITPVYLTMSAQPPHTSVTIVERSPIRATIISLIFGLIALFICTTGAHAQVLLERDRGLFTLKNLSPVDLIEVSRGKHSIGRLTSGETWTAEEVANQDLFGDDIPLQVSGRIDLAQWDKALEQLPSSSLWAHLQLSTAGFDVHKNSVMSSLLGSQQKRAAIQALRQWNPHEDELQLDRASRLKLGLLAYASRYTSESTLLKRLLTLVSPNHPYFANQSASWPEGYEQLPSILGSIRQSIELHGTSALPMVIKNKAWAADRGFENIELAFALLPEVDVITALKDRGDLNLVTLILQRIEEEERVCQDRHAEGTFAAERHLRSILSAKQAGDRKRAISRAVSTVLMWRRNNLRPKYGQMTWMICNYLNIGAQSATNEKKLLAAQAFLNLSKDVCFGHPFYRSMAAEVMRVRGDLSSFDLNFDDALQWYRAAVWINDELVDRVRLIDTLSRLAIGEIAGNQAKKARDYLKEARNLETPQMPIRETLVVASRLMPTPDRRAQIGMIVLIFVLGIAAFSQLLRVLFGRKR